MNKRSRVPNRKVNAITTAPPPMSSTQSSPGIADSLVETRNFRLALRRSAAA
jgi:hypothetical protein